MSEDLVDEVTGYLPTPGISATTSANRVLREAIAPRLRSVKVAHDVSHIRTLDQLREALGEISRFARPGLRTEPLRQVMLRIGALPLGDRAQAMIGFREAANSLAAQDRPPEPPRLEKILMHGGPNRAVLNGENVAVVASVFGMNRPAQIRGLELRAIRSQNPNSASACLLAGANVREVADQFGITTPESLHDLELITIRSDAPNTAGAALRAGQSVQEIAHRFGITTPGGIRDLEDLAIRLAH